MSLDLLKHLYGFTNGIYFTVVIMLILYGLSYRKEFNWQITTAYVMVALSFVCFGFYNIFFQQIFTNVTASLYSRQFLKFCAVVTPFALLLLTSIYIKGYSTRSIRANARIKKEKWLVYIIYGTTIINIIAIYCVDDFNVIALMLLAGFVLPTIGAVRLAMVSKDKSFTNIGYIFLFGGLLLMVISAPYAMKHVDKLTPEENIIGNLFFGLVVIFSCFFSLRYSHNEMRSFFHIRQLDKKNIMGDVTKGINDNQFCLHYQPQLDLSCGEVTAAEALIRWNHPEKGLISPVDYIPLAEKSGFISDITMWVIRTAIKEAKQLYDSNFSLKISINFSPKDISDEVIDCLEKTLKRYNYPSNLVVVEITESLVINSKDEKFNKAMKRLHDLGVAISIDDYGTGFSSLSHIQRLDVQELKIDQSFITDLDYDSNNYAIVYSTLQMARNLGLITVAEGVEDNQTLSLLKEMKCNYAQGYGISKPMSFLELQTWLAENTKDNTFTNFKSLV